MADVYQEQARFFANVPLMQSGVDVLMSELPPQDYWQIKKVASDIAVIV
jgi:hypothetical protein